MPYSAGVHPIAIARSVQKTGLTYNNFRSPNSPHICASALINLTALLHRCIIHETKKPPGKVVFRRFSKPASF
ncbi:hypothetical protein DN614_07195 [Klebsiella michiganensis]|nr:hypothetical protein DN614_07195 [Klebsiella michiganensis]